MHRNQSVSNHAFAMVPKAEIPRSAFNRQFTHKTTFNAGRLIPIYCDEVLPGDTFNMKATIFARMATPIYPIMDNLYLETFYFFVPNRLLWDNWEKFMGAQDNPGDSTDYTIPRSFTPIGGYAVGSLQDYMGLPTVGQVAAGQQVAHSALWPRAYNLIYNEWFRDQNVQGKVPIIKDDGPDENPEVQFTLLRRGKRHDYFTSCLPWIQKGPSVPMPLGDTAPVISNQISPAFNVYGYPAEQRNLYVPQTAQDIVRLNGGFTNTGNMIYGDESGLVADLSEATAATINQLRQSFQIQKLLERDARGGTRYTEIIRAHFGVQSPDYRLQRPEYLGGGMTPININPIAQTSATALTGSDTPIGTLSAFGTGLLHDHGFSASFTEHGVIIGLASVRADLTYQQGLHRMWSRQTRYDFYFPAFAALGEQAVLKKEIYATGTPEDEEVFGYQERWAEYRYKPSQITGMFRSTSAGTLDGWHLAQRFTECPELNSEFIEENVPMERVLAVGGEADGTHFIVDAFFNNKVARPMPLYSVPGLIDHF